MHAPQLPHVAERTPPDITGAGEADLLVARDRRRPESDGDCIAVGPKGELAGLDHASCARLARHPDGRTEVNLMAPVIDLPE